MLVRDRYTKIEGEYLGMIRTAYNEYYIVKTSGGLKIWINTKDAEVISGDIWEMI